MKTKFDEDLAVEVLARYNGNSRGVPIAKDAFIVGALWAADQFKPRWVKVSERLPEVGELVTIYRKGHITTGYIIIDGSWRLLYGERTTDVTHWTTLLTPPTE